METLILFNLIKRNEEIFSQLILYEFYFLSRDAGKGFLIFFFWQSMKLSFIIPTIVTVTKS